MKVKYRETNGKVYASVAAMRLFWALGFGADGVYQVRLTCRGCPQDPWTATEPRLPSVVFEHAIVEREMPGHVIESRADEGWKFPEPAAGLPAEDRVIRRAARRALQRALHDGPRSRQHVRARLEPRQPLRSTRAERGRVGDLSEYRRWSGARLSDGQRVGVPPSALPCSRSSGPAS